MADRFGRVTECVVQAHGARTFFFDEMPEDAVIRVTSATERGRCARSQGVPVGTDTTAQ